MSELKQIEEWYDIVENFTKDSQDYFSIDVMTRYIYSYYRSLVLCQDSGHI